MVIDDNCLARLICPICRLPLQSAPGRWHCPAGHSFDRAKEGYVNLLPARGRKGQSQGDSAEMLHARRRFLRGGGYDPLVSEIIIKASAVSARHPARGFTVLDAGCGTGFYLRRLQKGLNRPDGCFLGMDLAKKATRLAARHNPEAIFFVGDTRHQIYCPDRSVHLLLNIFSPRNADEFARVLAAHGRLLVLIPTPQHLQNLPGGAKLIGIEADKLDKVSATMAPAFRLLDSREITFPLTLKEEQLVDLVRMTPRARHLTPGTYAGLRRQVAVDTIVSVQLLEFGHH